MIIFLQLYKNIRRIGLRLGRSDLARILAALLGIILIGAVVYSRLEGWSFLDALYATVITITTVGYGDFAPQTTAGRVFAIFFTLIAIGIGGYSISTFAAYTIERRQRIMVRRHRKRLMYQIRTFNKHYILCGADLLGTRIAEEFYLQKAHYVIVDDDEARLKTAMLYAHPEYVQQKIKTLIDFNEVDLSAFEDLTLAELSDKLSVPYLLADPTDDAVLIQAGLERAIGLIAARPDDRDNLSIIIGARSLAKRANNHALRIMTRANDPGNMRKMYLAGADFVRIPTIVSGMEMASHMLHPELGNWWYSRSGEDRTDEGMFQQISISDYPRWFGSTVSKVHEIEHTLIISVKRDGKFISPPTFDLRLQPGDIAIVLK